MQECVQEEEKTKKRMSECARMHAGNLKIKQMLPWDHSRFMRYLQRKEEEKAAAASEDEEEEDTKKKKEIKRRKTK